MKTAVSIAEPLQFFYHSCRVEYSKPLLLTVLSLKSPP